MFKITFVPFTGVASTHIYKSVINIKKIIFVILITLFCLTNGNAVIKDSLFATVGNKAITHSDIVNEIKTILICKWSKFF